MNDKTGREVPRHLRVHARITLLWLLSANQVANQLAERSCQLYRRIQNGKRNAGTIFLGDRPMVDRFIRDRNIARAEATPAVIEGAVEDKG
jgi:hypothetical protein